MLDLGYARLLVRLAWLKLRYRGRLVTDGLCFVGPGVTLEIGKGATLHLGRWCVDRGTARRSARTRARSRSARRP